MGLRIDVDTSRGNSSLKDFRKNLEDTGVAAQLTEREIKALEERFERKLQADDAAAALAKTRRQIEEVGKAAGLTQREIDGLARKAGLSAAEIAKMNQSMTGVSGIMDKLSAGATALGSAVVGAFSVAAIVNMGRAIGETKLQFESMERAMSAVTGSQAGASAAMQYVADTSDNLGVRLTSAAEGYKTIAAAAKGTTLEGAGAKAAFESVSEAAAALGLSSDQSSGALLALGQMISKGKVQAEELRGQLGERLPGAFQVAARAMNMTTAELDDMMSKGGLVTTDFLPKFAAELHKTYGQAAVEAGNSGQASFNKLANSWDQLKLALADTGAWSVALSFVGNLTSGINRLSAATREAAGTLQGLQKIQSIETKIQQAKNNISMAEAGRGIFSGLDDMGILESQAAYITRQQNEIIKLEQEGAAERQKVSEQTRHEYARRSLTQINKQAEDEAAAINNGQKETLKAWEGSSDKKTSLWAKNLSDTSEAYQKAYKGEITHGAMEAIIEQANQKYDDGLEAIDKKGSKAAENAANAAAKYGESASSFYDNVAASLAQMEDSLTGGTEKNGLRTDKWFEQQFDAIRKATIGAKGDVEEYKQAWALLEQMWPGMKMLAVLQDTSAELRKEAQLLKDIADATGDPAMKQQAGALDTQAWYNDRKQQIESLQKTQEEKTALMEQLEAAKATKMLQVNAEAYEGISAVSSKYWEAEKQLLAQRLQLVKANSEDELAFKVYAAQQEDELRRKQLESEAQYAGTFGETLSAKWSLAFGGYESETTKAKKRWDSMADGMVEATDGLIEGVSGGIGDLIRNIGNGTASIEDLWRNMLARMLDAFAGFVEKLVQQQLEDLVGGLFSGSGSGGLKVSGLTGSKSSSGSLGAGVDALKTLGDYVGKSSGNAIGDYLTTAASSGDTFLLGGKNAMADIFSEGLDTSNLGKFTKDYFSVGAEAVASTYSAAETAAMAGTSVLGTVGSVLGVVGAIGGVVGLLSGLFGEQKEEIRKVASGYNVSYVGGHASASGVDFYSDGSVIGTGAADPAVTKKIADSFRNAAENLSDFADELGFATDVLEGFAMPSMNITTDQVDAYIANGINMMAFKGLMEAGLRGAFDAVARDGEVYSDEYDRLGASLSAVQGKFEAYGYELSDVAQITQEQIDALSATNIEVAQGTAQAMLNMAASMGATSDQLALIAANADDGSAALAVTNEQLSTILEADYASDLLDAVGGEDAFAAIMGNLTANIFDTIEAYAANLDYYNERAERAIAKLGDASVTVDNFWTKFDAAIKEGLTVDEFEAWGKASSWVANIDAVTKAVEDFAAAMESVSQSLDVRLLKAQGQSDAAERLQQLIDAERELADAREAGYSAAMLAKIAATQAAERAALEAKQARTQWEALLDLIAREKAAAGDPYADAASAYHANIWEYADAESGGLYTPEMLARLKKVQEKEISNYYDDIAQATEENAQSARARLLRAMGQSDAADIYEAQAAAERDLREARKSGLYTTEAYADLSLALAEEIANLAAAQEQEAGWYKSGLEARLASARGLDYEASRITAMIDAERELADAREAGYDAATMALQAQVRAAEMAQAALEELNRIRSDWAALESRMLAAQGDEFGANWSALLEQQRQELYEAYAGGKSQEYINRLKQVQSAEQADRWRELIEDAVSELKSSLNDLVSAFSGAFGDFSDLLDEEIDRVSSLADSARSTNSAVSDAIDAIMLGDDSVLSSAEKALSLSGRIDTAYRTMLAAGHGQARIEAAGDLEDLAGDYLDALRASGGSEDYLAGYLDVLSKLREAESITATEGNYYQRIVDGLEAQQGIFDLILKELQKEDPNTSKLQDLNDISGDMGEVIARLYADETSGATASWKAAVAAQLSASGATSDEIATALGTNSSQYFLAALAKFNTETMPGHLTNIVTLLKDIRDKSTSVITPPEDGYTEDEQNWAAHLVTAMNAQNYGGRHDWTSSAVLPNLAAYTGWGAAYGISPTSDYLTPTAADRQYYYAKAADLNADGYQSSWLDIQAAIANQYGSGNYLAHWLDYGMSEGVIFPSTDAAMYKVAQYYAAKWHLMGGENSGNRSPLQNAYKIEEAMGIGRSNAFGSLRDAAKLHYDQYGYAEGLPKPYRLGGTAEAGSLALVGEEGPEILRIGSTSAITPHSSSMAILRDAAADSIAAVTRAMDRLETKLDDQYRAMVEIVRHTRGIKTLCDKWDTVALPVRVSN